MLAEQRFHGFHSNSRGSTRTRSGQSGEKPPVLRNFCEFGTVLQEPCWMECCDYCNRRASRAHAVPPGAVKAVAPLCEASAAAGR